MLKATFVMSTLSFVASSVTLVVAYKSAKKAQQEVEELRTKTNDALNKMKRALVDFSV